MTRALVLLCMVIILPLVRCHKIHEHMTREEMLSVFYTGHESGNNSKKVTCVPPYEVVPVLHTMHKRSIDAKPQIHLKAFGKDINLSLKPTEGLLTANSLPMWTVTRNASQPDGLHYERVKDVDVDIGDIYQDTENMASILLHQDTNGKVRLDGTIGSELVIRPLPERVLQEVVSKSPALRESTLLPNLTENENLRRTSHHVIFKKVDRPVSDEYSDFSLMEPDHLAKRYRIKRSTNNRSKREAPYVIYPEILCIVDYDGYRLHGGDNVQIKRYFVSFWNGVDLRYKLLKGPKIRISIAGIIISRGRDATPYLERNRVGRDAIDSAAALTDMGKYLFRERRLPVYDIAVAVTKYDMCRRRKGGRCTKGTAGFAYVGGACVVNKRLEKVNSVAIIEDTGGFSGIIVAAHEVGHLLGAVHDGSPPPSYLGGPGAEKCRWEDGYIMSDLRHTEKGFKWSHCSVSSFHHFLNGDTATCLYNAPHEDEALPRVLPGKLLSLDAQCRKDRGTSACFKDDRVCAQLFCFDAGSGYCVAYRPAAEGSPCGDGQYCLNGKCVAEHENIIPDYTQNIPTYIRRDSIFSPTLHNRPIFAQYNSTDYRYPWKSTTQSTPLSKLKHSSPYTNALTATTTTSTTTTTTTMTTTKTITTNPYKRVIAPFVVTTPTVPKYTQMIVNNHCINRYKTRYNDSSSGNNGSCNRGGNVNTTTKRSVNLFNSHYTSSTVAKVTASPFKYKNTVNVMSLSTTTKGYQKGLGSIGRGTEVGECTDVGSDCAELIDRLRTWLCHLQSVKSRCCAFLKTICVD
ncbi:A disintegrin and metalloproteinase with thrombospondin motifs 1-like isoform X2 [Odontomachus brunneus]|uniref:A disintegrin and metalloproteinase with thrombospondin motifs 1-like isoform X2 n=1 Tax=Odontomachus brunneus TaxID=486640 RepID=UPI0013F22D61|nr:A disintegrin and metalloproteinase with thrombospondin motifs 1-like isoform X2 [Odontomachus brunneus]